MNKTIDLNQSVYNMCNEYPELLGILHDLGFKDIIKPGMLNTAGRFMTIKKGAMLKKISLDIIKETLTLKGYEVVD
ncbi:MAG: DUF1858 domain-containing protein [Clostridiales bacterium]|nr:DUF1858 domain-containing protein [Clostridiales bacterium]